MLFAPKEKGQGLVEYALILVLVAIVVAIAGAPCLVERMSPAVWSLRMTLAADQRRGSNAGSLQYPQRVPTVPDGPERSASLVLSDSMVGLTTSATPGMARTLSKSWLIAAMDEETSPSATLR